ncbi:hypothetical protein K437DRAFT_255448 [Tilletiaria anomala UBC 951]|uniref:Uncharacterized protein n=1 Tax=Tilletiaria anomala (strain ATCC 24038 / CBS 436.72 / UBC 951) TaxID=1037660 RepID=A0A066WCU6_TILAU|nr:uncharacterized protein K437DRAFT_255448 [Tilletiaria anomala UBC 951]KDN48889.1 hypothetical protein K437DRAFT_255448 [Tilletiaria anomala UBC 951]
MVPWLLGIQLTHITIPSCRLGAIPSILYPLRLCLISRHLQLKHETFITVMLLSSYRTNFGGRLMTGFQCPKAFSFLRVTYRQAALSPTPRYASRLNAANNESSTSSKPVKVKPVQRAAFPPATFIGNKFSIGSFRSSLLSFVLHRVPRQPSHYKPPFLPDLITRSAFKDKWLDPLRFAEARYGTQLFGPTQLDEVSLPEGLVPSASSEYDNIRFGVPVSLLTDANARSALLAAQEAALREAEQRVLRVLVVAGKKRVHKAAVVRNQCRTRTIFALEHVLAGRRVGQFEIQPNTSLRSAISQWAKDGHVLTVHLTLQCATAPMDELIKVILTGVERLCTRNAQRSTMQRGSRQTRKKTIRS